MNTFKGKKIPEIRRPPTMDIMNGLRNESLYCDEVIVE